VKSELIQEVQCEDISTITLIVIALNGFGESTIINQRKNFLLNSQDPDEAIDVDENGEQVELNVTTTTKPTLTGIPQIDYVHDPNLPRELNGYNLTDYPFLNSVPEEIEFKCDGLHDGFYASIPHKCQVSRCFMFILK